jgi:hypothetical protein
MVQFVVKGPFSVPQRRGAAGGSYIDESRLNELKAQSADLTKPGCYVFACRASRASLPVYVGQAAKNIFDEAFNARNVNNLNNYLSYRLRGQIEVYVIHQCTVRGDTGNKACIDDIEDFLIGWASRRNEKLLNIHGNRPSQWSISGVANHNNENGGHPGSSVLAFKEMMGMKMKKAKTEPKLDAAEEIAPEEVESVTQTTDVGEADGGAGADTAQAPTQH